MTEAAAVTGVKLCKLATYINTNDSNNVVFQLVQCIINDLKVGDRHLHKHQRLDNVVFQLVLCIINDLKVGDHIQHQHREFQLMQSRNLL